MGADDIRAAVDGAVGYLSANPDEARYTDSAATALIRDGLHATVEGPSGERIETDLPRAIGGEGEHPSPGWLSRAAIASCVASLFVLRAAMEEASIGEVRVTVDSESDDRGILGMNVAVPAGPLSVRVRFAVAGADETTVRRLAEWAVAHCPSSEALGRVVPVSIEVEPAPPTPLS